MAILWDDDKIFKLIETFESKRILWDFATKDHKTKPKRNIAWDEIATELELPRSDVEGKMHVLRSQFMREKKRIGSGEILRSKWKFYEPLAFLISGMINGGADNSNTNTTTIQGVGDIQKTDSPEPGGGTWSVQYLGGSGALTSQPQPLQSTPPTVKRKIENNNSELLQVVRYAKRKMDETDEFDIYGQYVASELRSAKTEHGAIMAKSFINNILIHMRMGKYDRGHDNDVDNHDNSSRNSQEYIAKQENEFEELISEIELPDSDCSSQ